jgi:hypothetical protein
VTASFPVDLDLKRGFPGRVIDAEERRAWMCRFQAFGQSLIGFGAAVRVSGRPWHRGLGIRDAAGQPKGSAFE